MVMILKARPGAPAASPFSDPTATTGSARLVTARAAGVRRSLSVALVSYRLPAVGEKRGGVDVVAHDLANGLAARGHQVTVWSYDARPAGALYEVRALPARKVFESWLGMRLIAGYAGNLVSAMPAYERADVVIAMGDSLLLPLRGKPVVRTMHGSALGEALAAATPWRFLMQMGVYAQELVTAVLQPGCVAVSESTRRYNPFVRRVIPNGVDLTDFYADPEGKTSEPSILFVGALDGRKRGSLLLQWFQDVVRVHHPTANLAIVGPAGSPSPGVTYHQGIARAELAALYRRAWVYASPSSYEGFGLPYVEAMASGTPVVATPNPGSREVLGSGEYGLLPDDESFAKVLVELLGDPARRADLTERGLRRSAVYTLDRMIDAYEALLGEVAPTRGRRR